MKTMELSGKPDISVISTMSPISWGPKRQGILKKKTSPFPQIFLHTSSTKRVDYGAACSNGQNAVVMADIPPQSY